MAFPDPRFVACFPLQEYFVDKDTGLPLSAGSVTFYEDNDRTVLKPIYQQSQGPNNTYVFTQLNNPLTLTSVGTFADNNGNDIIPFLYPFVGFPTDIPSGAPDLYYVTVYSSGGILQFTREAWPPNSEDSSSAMEGFESTENQISNPQFVEVSFQPDPASGMYTFSVSGSNTATPVAPDWSIITNGTGTVTVQQFAVQDTTAPSNPPYALFINSSSVQTITLRQRLLNSPRLFANLFASAYFVAASADGMPHALTLTYAPSDSGTAYNLANGVTTANGTFTSIFGVSAIGPTINTDPATIGYVDILISIPVAAKVYISSVQLINVQNLASPFNYFLEQSTARQKDHLWHYYESDVINRAKDSILTGWIFGLNPFQAQGTSSVNFAPGSPNFNYIADQTILCQQTATSLATSLSGNTLQIAAQSAATQGRFAIVQYIDSSSVLPYWGSILSSLVKSTLVTTQFPPTVLNIKAKLIYRSTVPADTNPVVSWPTGDIGLAAGWTAVAPLNDPVFTVGNGAFQYASFNQFAVPALPTSGAMFALVIYTTNTLNSAGTPDVWQIEKASLTPTSFAIEANPQTYDQVLRSCYYYYESTYPLGSKPGTATFLSSLSFSQPTSLSGDTGGTYTTFPSNFSFNYAQKRSLAPAIAIYNPNVANTQNFVYGQIVYVTQVVALNLNLNHWGQYYLGDKTATYIGQTTSAILTGTPAGMPGTTIAGQGFINFHATIDARLGLVA